jgi:hypothetical protein
MQGGFGSLGEAKESETAAEIAQGASYPRGRRVHKMDSARSGMTYPSPGSDLSRKSSGLIIQRPVLMGSENF